MLDLMLVCRNGHVITDRLKANPQLRLPKCDRCGAGTIDRCDTCGQLLVGANPVPGFEPVATRAAPSVCSTCGTVFPWKREVPPSNDDPFASLERLLRRVPRVAYELGRRERAPVFIRTERDLDDVLRAILPILFDDIRVERPGWRFANQARLIFLLPESRWLVSANLADGEFTESRWYDRLHEQVAYCEQHDVADSLIAFLYDPERRIRQPERLEARSGSTVRVVVAAN